MSKPNIVIIYPDQMRADVLSCAGNPCIQTPTMDRLASEGLRFTNAFTSFPLCCPFRASLMTGKYAHSNGMHANHYPIPLDQHFLPQLLRASGYQTGYVGKWHLNGGKKYGYVEERDRLGFESFVGFSRGHNYFNPIFYRDNDRTPRTSNRYEPDLQTDHLISFMQQSIRDPAGRPFFAMVCYGPPHPPLHAPEDYLTRHAPQDVPVNENTPDDEETRSRARSFLSRYYGLVESVDQCIGRVMDWLESSGAAANTIVVVVSDHGELAYEHGLSGKKSFYRSSMQVPMIIHGPQVAQPGRTVDCMVDPSVDLMPTLLDLCDIAGPSDTQGTSFLTLLTNPAAPATRDAIFYEILMEAEGPERFPVPERGVRTRDWLYVRTPDGPVGLFDQRNDPLEMLNLADSSEYTATRALLDRQLSDHMIATNDSWETRALFPPPDFQTHQDAAEAVKTLQRIAVVEA